VLYFFGTERDGLSEEILQRRWFSKIPMVGFTESLNSFGGNHHSKLDESIAIQNRLALIRN
jgi:hypothetical protein